MKMYIREIGQASGYTGARIVAQLSFGARIRNASPESRRIGFLR
ncbi:MAG: hypothetical protein OJF49_004418 [Ktedonobacterales bacterium]|jgi:hypothetical protein|nr:MAG: hypothetical protein OJF49_004418 [Ktedonobacterales bacterium]